MVFEDLQKLVLHSQQENTHKELFKRMQDKPFWIWIIDEHKQEDAKTNGDYCFNHIIGLPQKDGNDKSLYDYEERIFDSLVARRYNTNPPNNHVWIKKTTGVSISEFILRFMVWLCIKITCYQVHKCVLSETLE